MKNLLLGLLVLGFTTQFMFSQVEKLPEVKLGLNYEYLEAIDSENISEVVRELENRVAFYDLTNSDFYNVEYDSYRVKFYTNGGRIVADYDANGKIIETVERFKNVRLPNSILIVVHKQYPGWTIVEDVYTVDYYDGIAESEYKIKLKNKDKKMTIRIDNQNDNRLTMVNSF